MKKITDDLTMNEALQDPLIAQVLRADGVRQEDFRRLLETAALKMRATGSAKNNFLKKLAPLPAAGSCLYC